MSDDHLSEEWRPVVGWEAFYSVSSLGRIRIERKTNVSKPGDFLSSYHAKGYLRVSLNAGNKSKGAFVHRLVAKAFLGEPPPGHEVNHKNGVRDDNRKENLEWVTKRENQQHAVVAFGSHCGENGTASKLNWSQVEEIRSLYNLGSYSQRCLARRYGVSQSAIGFLLRKQTWDTVRNKRINRRVERLTKK